MTRENLSESANISDRFIYDVENGNKGLSAESLLKIARALGVTCNYLMTGVSNNRNFSLIIELLKKLKDDDLKSVERIVHIFVRSVTNKYPK